MWPNRSLNRTLCSGPGLGFKSLAQTRPAAKCRLASTLASSVEISVAHQFCRFNYTPADTAVRFVSKMQSRFCALVNQFQTSRNVRRPLGGGALNHQNIACAARDIEHFAKKPERRIVLYRLQLIATGRRTLRETVARQKLWSGCGADPFSFKAANAVPFPFRHCWLTHRSTGHFAAVRVWPSFHSWPNPAHRKVPVSSNVRPRQHPPESFVLQSC